MDLPGHDDATDFRPFFDMVIGILFVLLILVAAQIYFQQAQEQTVSTDDTRRQEALRRADIASFVSTVADRLRAGGIAAAADGERGAVTLPLADVVTVGAAGLPDIDAARAGTLAATLSGLTACVTVPRSQDPACAAFGRLNADAAAVEMRVDALPGTAALPRDRFGDLATALLSASLLRGAPALIGASNQDAGRVVRFDTASGAPGAAVVGNAPSGSVSLDFTFR